MMMQIPVDMVANSMIKVYPPCYKVISFWINESFTENNLYELVRGIAGDLVEKEDITLKRCWLARYWGLCIHHGILADIAEANYNYWSTFAPNPFEVVLTSLHSYKLVDFLLLDL
ncbi:hypothetical protein Ahy_A05g025386 isoform B [Arachis hypogaea]|uniref:Uncharacterized protein n=1 Tax=Arachis hypogaea TaxID=3818 RepID=A0A445D8J7_ARAHY|nr:hypothetical protein Ahy_A05g025386 isoform B [Arachis hypogaea]